MANINKIRISGSTYNIEDSSATKTVKLTQAQYNQLSPKDPNTFYIITDAEYFDPSGYVTSAQTESAITAAVSGKQDTLISGTNIKTINNESILGSGNITIQGGGGGIDSGTVQTMIDESISGKTDTSAFTAHTGDSTIHVTSTEKATWNAKSDFSGSYNDLTDKPTLFSGDYNDLSNKPTIPSKTSDLTNDSNFATSGYVDSAVSGKANSSDVYTKSETSGATEISTALNAKLDTTAYTPTDLSNYYQKSETSGATEIATALSGKQDTLSAGTNITISGNVISAEGGGGKAIAAGTNISVTTGETADTVSCTLPITINNKKTVILPNNANNTANGEYSFVGGSYCQLTNYAGGAYPDYAFCHGYYNTVTTESEAAFGKFNQTRNALGAEGISGTSIFTIGNGNWTSRRHNALEVMMDGNIYIANTDDTSTANYYQKPMVRLQDYIQIKVVKLTQQEYDAITTKDNNTLYVIT